MPSGTHRTGWTLREGRQTPPDCVTIAPFQIHSGFSRIIYASAANSGEEVANDPKDKLHNMTGCVAQLGHKWCDEFLIEQVAVVGFQPWLPDSLTEGWRNCGASVALATLTRGTGLAITAAGSNGRATDETRGL